MINKFKLLLFLSFFFSLKSFAQSFYVSNGSRSICKVTILPEGGVLSEYVNMCMDSQYFSIAMNGDNFYWLEGSYLYQSKVDDLNMTDCKKLTSTLILSNALTAGADGKLYYTGPNLYTTDPGTGESKSLGRMSYMASGDVIFYKGNLYMAGEGIIRVDVNNTANSYVYMPTDNLNLYGLVSVATSLRKNTVYGLSYVSDNQTDIVEIDIDNKVIKGVVGSLPYGVLDAASEVENGSINGIVIDSIINRQDCDSPTKGFVEVVTTPSLNPLTYKLSNSDITFTNNTGVFTAVPAGTYQLLVTSAEDEQTETVTVPPYALTKPIYTYTVKKPAGSQTGEITFKTPDNDSRYLIQMGSDVFAINHTFTGLAAGTPYHFNILNQYGCKVDEINVDKFTESAISYTINNPVCTTKGDIRFTMLENSNYSIQYGGVTYPFNHVFDGLSAGVYQFAVLNSDGEEIDNYSIELKYQACPVVIDKVDITAECNAFGKAVVQVTTPPIPETYDYTLNGVTNNTGIFNLVEPGTYNLLVTTSGGGTSQIQTIVVPDFKLNKPAIEIKQINPVCELSGQISMTVDANSMQYDILYNGIRYSSDHVFGNLKAGTYEFTILKKSDGCIADIIHVDLLAEICSIVSFPTAFTPNGDGINDVFRANSESKAADFRLQIYNRWGQLVFTSNDLHEGWNGQYRGRPCATGTYYWVTTFIDQENRPAMQKGYVALIK